MLDREGGVVIFLVYEVGPWIRIPKLMYSYKDIYVMYIS